ncbi:hypothetical protein [uncultured Shimia sp.]|uniref:hypothetical protein n=1 Tax=uncultured Shimia sp. TaxID=573152 RepID=UPI0026220DEF|nr:hypothetical protein [uncultured Shimia sp.]
MKWSDCKDAFRADGSLRDIYVRNTTEDDWNRLFAAFSKYEMTLFCDGDPSPEIEVPAAIFERCNEHHYRLEMLAKGITFQCHFFTVDEIEIDVDPKEIKSQQDLDVVLDVMGAIGRALAKPVILTEEATQNYVWIAFDPATSACKYFAY